MDRDVDKEEPELNEEEEEEEGYNSKLNKRGNIDILLVANPGTSKSQRCIDEFVRIVYTALIVPFFTVAMMYSKLILNICII